MIFHDLGLIFIHVERTGGVALKKLLSQYEEHPEQIGTATRHITSENAQMKIPKEIWDTYLKIGFVRNPWDRMVSWYHACKQNPQWFRAIDQHFQEAKTFEEALTVPHPRMLITQSEKLKDIKWVGRFEFYKKDVEYLCNVLEIPYFDLQDNSSQHCNYRSYYNAKTKKLIEKWYKDDIERFNYAF